MHDVRCIHAGLHSSLFQFWTLFFVLICLLRKSLFSWNGTVITRYNHQISEWVCPDHRGLSEPSFSCKRWDNHDWNKTDINHVNAKHNQKVPWIQILDDPKRFFIHLKVFCELRSKVECRTLNSKMWLLILPSHCYTVPCNLVTRIWC